MVKILLFVFLTSVSCCRSFGDVRLIDGVGLVSFERNNDGIEFVIKSIVGRGSEYRLGDPVYLKISGQRKMDDYCCDSEASYLLITSWSANYDNGESCLSLYEVKSGKWFHLPKNETLDRLAGEYFMFGSDMSDYGLWHRPNSFLVGKKNGSPVFYWKFGSETRNPIFYSLECGEKKMKISYQGNSFYIGLEENK